MEKNKIGNMIQKKNIKLMKDSDLSKERKDGQGNE